MTQVPKNLVSEQIPNDGGWHWNRLIREANDRLGKIGKHGKRAKIKVTPKPGNPISAQFSLPGQGQKSYGLDLPLSRNNLVKAEEYCQLITTQLVTGTFTEDWFYSLIGKEQKTSEKQQEKVLTCKEMLEQYKAHYFKQQKGNKYPDSNWRNHYTHIEAVLNQYSTSFVDLKIVREIIEKTANNSPNRTKHLNGLVNLFKYFGNTEFKEIIKQYKMLQPLNLPDMLNPLKKRGNTIPCSNNTAHWFKRKKYGFTPHALRHAYNIRGHKLGINQKILADSLGHGLRMNDSTYLKNEGDLSKLQGLMQAITEDKVKRSEIEILKAEIEHLKVENGKLRTKLAMYEAIKTDL
ncbi:MAG: hypothetical protein QNJ65_09135 [Xenococcaceae cyanobacterium MO_234.B1]|nr:hypothetical protein [Xenococcaceae cyanobacterium MO_234.B1]